MVVCKKLIINDKKLKNILFVFFTLYILCFTLSFSAFQIQDYSVRAESLGGCGNALLDEVSSMYYNPATVSSVEQKIVQFYYSKPYAGLDEDINFNITNVNFVSPFPILSLACGFNLMNVNNLYTESIAVVNLSTKLNRFIKNIPVIQIGVNLKMLTKSYNFDDEILKYEPELKNKNIQSVLSVDFGIISKLLKEKFVLGLSLHDVNTPDIAVVDNKDIVPLTLSFGSGYNFGDVKLGLYFEDLTVLTELRYRNQTYGDEYSKLFWSLGVETYLNFHTIGLRVGVNKQSVNLGFGYYGIKIAEKINFGINYAFGISTIYPDVSTNHKISVELRF